MTLKASVEDGTPPSSEGLENPDPGINFKTNAIKGRESDDRNSQNVEKFEKCLKNWHERHKSKKPKIVLYNDKQSNGDGGSTEKDSGKSDTMYVSALSIVYHMQYPSLRRASNRLY